MSYVNPSPPTKKPSSPMAKRGGGGALFLLMLVAGVFLMLSNANQQSGTNKADPDKTPSGIERGNVNGIATPDANGRQMPTTGGNQKSDGWDMEDAQGKRDPNDEWDVDLNPEEKDDSTGLRLKSSNKETEEPEWSIDDDAGKKKDDWAIDDVDK